jgi:predicted nucleotidyltransferase
MQASTAIGARLAEYFQTQQGVAAAWLFGSHRHGRAHRESDIDIAVLLDHRRFPEPAARFQARVALIADLIAVLHCNDVDLVVLNDAPPLLARRIVLEGLRVHCADGEAEHAFRRDVQLRAADLAPFLQRARARLLASRR